jgi:hypothetical protein
MAKPRRTSRELLEAIMHEVRRHPEWNDILSVTITKRLRRSRTSLHDAWSSRSPGGRI